MTDLTSLLSRHERWEARRSVIKSIVFEEKRSIEKLDGRTYFYQMA